MIIQRDALLNKQPTEKNPLEITVMEMQDRNR